MEVKEMVEERDVLFLPYCQKHCDFEDDLSRFEPKKVKPRPKTTPSARKTKIAKETERIDLANGSGDVSESDEAVIESEPESEPQSEPELGADIDDSSAFHAYVEENFKPIRQKDLLLIGHGGPLSARSRLTRRPLQSPLDPSFFVPPLGRGVRQLDEAGQPVPSLPSYHNPLHVQRLLAEHDAQGDSTTPIHAPLRRQYTANCMRDGRNTTLVDLLLTSSDSPGILSSFAIEVSKKPASSAHFCELSRENSSQVYLSAFIFIFSAFSSLSRQPSLTHMLLFVRVPRRPGGTPAQVILTVCVCGFSHLFSVFSIYHHRCRCHHRHCLHNDHHSRSHVTRCCCQRTPPRRCPAFTPFNGTLQPAQ